MHYCWLSSLSRSRARSSSSSRIALRSNRWLIERFGGMRRRRGDLTELEDWSELSPREPSCLGLEDDRTGIRVALLALTGVGASSFAATRRDLVSRDLVLEERDRADRESSASETLARDGLLSVFLDMFKSALLKGRLSVAVENSKLMIPRNCESKPEGAAKATPPHTVNRFCQFLNCLTLIREQVIV